LRESDWLLFVRGAATGGGGACRIDRRVSLLDVGYLPVFIHYEGGTVGHPHRLDQYAIGLGDLALGEIAEQRKGSAYFGGEFFLGRGVVGTDAKNFDVC